MLGEFEERGITKEVMVEAIESAMATAYKREYGKRGQIVRAMLDMNSGTVTFEQVKTIVDDTMVRFPTPDEEIESEAPERHHHHENEQLKVNFLVSTRKSTFLLKMLDASSATQSWAANLSSLLSHRTISAELLLRPRSRSSFRKFAKSGKGLCS